LMRALEGGAGHILQGLLPWTKSPEKAEQIELLTDLLQAVHDRDHALMDTIIQAGKPLQRP
jgi:hypothetical protein